MLCLQGRVNRPTCPLHGNVGTTQAKSPVECTPASTDDDSDYERSRSRSRRSHRRRRQRFDLRPERLADRLVRRIHSSGDSPLVRWPMGPADTTGADLVADIAEWMMDAMNDLVADTMASVDLEGRQSSPLIDIWGSNNNINLNINMT